MTPPFESSTCIMQSPLTATHFLKGNKKLGGGCLQLGFCPNRCVGTKSQNIFWSGCHTRTPQANITKLGVHCTIDAALLRTAAKYHFPHLGQKFVLAPVGIFWDFFRVGTKKVMGWDKIPTEGRGGRTRVVGPGWSLTVLFLQGANTLSCSSPEQKMCVQTDNGAKRKLSSDASPPNVSSLVISVSSHYAS